MENHVKRLSKLHSLGFTPHNILDIGAYKGDWTKVISEVFSQANFFMIEANPAAKPFLSQNNFPHVIALLGAEPRDSVDFYISKHPVGHTGSSVYLEQTQYFEDATISKLPMTTLDNLLAQYYGESSIPDYQLIKMDVQGSELDILKGAQKTVDGAEFILLEVQLLQYNKGAPLFIDVVQYMDSIDFRVYDIVDLQYLETGHLNELDVLFTRKDSRFVPLK